MTVAPLWSGQLRHRIVIQRRVATRAPDGGEVPSWVDESRLWSKFSERGQREPFAGGREVSQADAQFMVRWQPSLLDLAKGSHRVIYKDEVYELTIRPENMKGANLVGILHVKLKTEDADIDRLLAAPLELAFQFGGGALG